MSLGGSPSIFLISAFGLLFMCVFFQVSGYWLSGGEDVVGLLKYAAALSGNSWGWLYSRSHVLWFF